MDVGLIVFFVVSWLILGFIAASATEEVSDDGRAVAVAFFWPVTVPILLVFGIIYAAFSAFAISFSWFRGR